MQKLRPQVMLYIPRLLNIETTVETQNYYMVDGRVTPGIGDLTRAFLDKCRK